MTSEPREQPDGPPARAGLPEAPEWIREDPTLVALYDESMQNLIVEARGLPMHTVQEFLLERIVTMYVTIRFRETHRAEWGAGAASTRAEQIYTGAWLDMVKEWNKVLASGQEKMREAILADVEKLMLAGIETVEDPETRKGLLRFYKTSFARMGM